jgi:hypothetical protein
MSKTSGKDIPGNSLASAQAVARTLIRQAETIAMMEFCTRDWEDADTYMGNMTIKFPTYERSEYMIVARCQKEGQALVCFHNAPTFLEVVSGFCERLRNGTLKWKEDQYG